MNEFNQASTMAWPLRWGKESILLALICTTDLLTTLYLIATRQANEWNPIMAASLRGGILVFIATKLASFVPAIVIAESYRRHRPRFISTLLYVVSFGYVVIYAVLFAKANQHF